MDEIVVTMSKADFDALRTIWTEALERAEGKQAYCIRDLIARLAHNSNTLTLDWLDRKRAEFP